MDSHSSARGVYFCGKRRFLFLVSFRLSKVDKKQNEMWIGLSLQTEMERQDRKGWSKKVYTAAVQKTLRSDLGCCIAVIFPVDSLIRNYKAVPRRRTTTTMCTLLQRNKGNPKGMLYNIRKVMFPTNFAASVAQTPASLKDKKIFCPQKS